MPFTYDYPRPAVTVDMVLCTVGAAGALQVLLIRRKHDPFAGRWALPGGFVDAHEDLPAAARRELREETGVAVDRIVQVGAYGTPGRDPRGHTVGVAFLAVVGPGEVEGVAGDDAADCRWFAAHRPPPLAFDHGAILRDARRRLAELAGARAVPAAVLRPPPTGVARALAARGATGARIGARGSGRARRHRGVTRIRPALRGERPASSGSPTLIRLHHTLVVSLCALAACGSSPSHASATEARSDAAPATPAQAPTPPMNATNDLYSLTTKSLEGQPVELSSYRGKVTLIVNVASECGYTPQYAGLQRLHEKYAARGFAVLGFPSNEFGGQEPGSPAQIRAFCTSKYGVSFPMFDKLATKAGPGQSPIYAALSLATGQTPSWNFCKYLVGKDGNVLGFYPSKVSPESPELQQAIEKALQ